MHVHLPDGAMQQTDLAVLVALEVIIDSMIGEDLGRRPGKAI